MTESIGVVGLGRMGGAMARHLLDAGFVVVGHDVEPAAAAALEAAGGRAVDSPAAVAATVGRVVTSLPSAAALAAVVDGDDGLLAAGRAGLLVIETSTLALDDKLRAHEAAAAGGATLLDCPISGTSVQAQARDVVVYASGDEAAIDACRDVFEAIARHHVALGVFGTGSKMKYLANQLVAVHTAAAAEALVLGTKAGLDPTQVLEVLTSGAGSSRMLEVRGPSMVAGRYEPVHMSASLFGKDLRIVGDFARDLDCPVPLFEASAHLYRQLVADGLGDADLGAVCTVLERLAGIDRDEPPAQETT